VYPFSYYDKSLPATFFATFIFNTKITESINPVNPVAETKPPTDWVDSVFKTLSQDEQIAQLMVVRLSTYDAKNKKAIFFEEQVDSLVRQYNIGGICLFQEAR
jgi:hypothetical protein